MQGGSRVSLLPHTENDGPDCSVFAGSTATGSLREIVRTGIKSSVGIPASDGIAKPDMFDTIFNAMVIVAFIISV
jgi:hypothetical protein